MSTPRTIYQPLHPSIRPLLDPEYVALHDSVIQYVLPTEHPSAQWTPVSRSKPSAMAHCVQRPIPVGAVHDLTPSTESFQARVYVPSGDAPEGEQGWPALVWFHGGGWVNGGLASEAGFLSHLCHYLQCVVITINYRHAPEHVFPTAHDDALAGWRWATDPATAGLPKLDLDRVAIGGLSAGGNLAISTALQATTADPLSQPTTTRPIFQLLICPVIDNTATPETAWATSLHSPFLTPGRMEWYRQRYFAEPAHREEWTASPCYAPEDALGRLPPTFMAIAGCDLLAPEERAFAALLEGAGVPVEGRVYEGVTHSVLVLAGVHKLGKEVVHDASAALAKAFGRVYDRERAPVLGLLAEDAD
ncbi:AB hydrolase superfamily protein [Podospora conica]|nr:AB hydrolase superfamily protein [Schizothecium conicum]